MLLPSQSSLVSWQEIVAGLFTFFHFLFSPASSTSPCSKNRIQSSRTAGTGTLFCDLLSLHTIKAPFPPPVTGWRVKSQLWEKVPGPPYVLNLLRNNVRTCREAPP